MVNLLYFDKILFFGSSFLKSENQIKHSFKIIAHRIADSELISEFVYGEAMGRLDLNITALRMFYQLFELFFLSL